MIHPIWRLSETSGDDNLGLACTEQGLVLGRTALIERRDGRFVVREASELQHLLSHAYCTQLRIDRLMPGLATVAAALNADDQALARIAAVHLHIPDLPSYAARDTMEAADTLIKYARDEGEGSWNPALHPRAGAPPNPGWFAPTGVSGLNHLRHKPRKTTIRQIVPMSRRALETNGSVYSPDRRASMNLPTSSNGSPTPSPKTNRRSERRSSDISKTSAIRAALPH